MSFFQSSVLNKHLKTQDTKAVDIAYEKFSAYFQNVVTQENIRQLKEEQYQGEFLDDLFAKILGYTKNPKNNFNLTTTQEH